MAEIKIDFFFHKILCFSMLDVSEFINEVKRDSEQLDLIKAIQVSITDWDIQVW